MSEKNDPVPYREDRQPPEEKYVLAELVDQHGNSLGKQWVLPSSLKHGQTRNEEIDALLPVVRWTWKHLSSHLSWCRSFEDWQLGFMRDEHPATQIAAWARSTYAYLEFMHKHPGADRKAVVGALCSMMWGREAEVEPRSVLRTLKTLVSSPPPILQDVTNFTKDGRFKAKEKHLR